MFCPFCEQDSIFDGTLLYARYDKYPVSEGHCLIVPKRHIDTGIDISKEEQTEAFELLDKVKALIDEKYSPDGYNIEINCGETAGQTITHENINVISRDMVDMYVHLGGVR